MTSTSFEAFRVCDNGMVSADAGYNTSGTSMPIAGPAILDPITQERQAMLPACS